MLLKYLLDFCRIVEVSVHTFHRVDDAGGAPADRRHDLRGAGPGPDHRHRADAGGAEKPLRQRGDSRRLLSPVARAEVVLPAPIESSPPFV